MGLQDWRFLWGSDHPSAVEVAALFDRIVVNGMEPPGAVVFRPGTVAPRLGNGDLVVQRVLGEGLLAHAIELTSHDDPIVFGVVPGGFIPPDVVLLRARPSTWADQGIWATAGYPSAESVGMGEQTGPDWPGVQARLDAVVGGATATVGGRHGPFWRGKSRDEIVRESVLGQPLIVVGNGAASNLVRALRGEPPFGSGGSFPQMPLGRPPMAAVDIDYIRRWIDARCPEGASSPATSTAPSTPATAPIPPPGPDAAVVVAPDTRLPRSASQDVAFFRRLDAWTNPALGTVTPTTQARIFSDFFPKFAHWQAWAVSQTSTAEANWVRQISLPSVRAAVAYLSSGQKMTVAQEFGNPIPLLSVQDAFEAFGADMLPADPLRPAIPRHNMDGAMMWFVWAAFADAAIRLGIDRDFWTHMNRAILAGVVSDAINRRRPAAGTVQFDQTSMGPVVPGPGMIATYVGSRSLMGVAAELRRVYRESGLRP